jgi:hypothetical protein
MQKILEIFDPFLNHLHCCNDRSELITYRSFLKYSAIFRVIGGSSEPGISGNCIGSFFRLRRQDL